MKTLLILVASLFTACAQTTVPKFPEGVKDYYLVSVPEGEMSPLILEATENSDMIPMHSNVACLKFEVLNAYPFKLKYIGFAPLIDCNNVGGYTPAQAQMIFNWINEVYEWAQARKACFTNAR